MRTLLAAALLATAAVTPALAHGRNFNVGGFDRVSSSGPWDVRIHTGKGPSVHAEGPKDRLDRLQIEVIGGELRIGTKPGSWSWGWNWGKSERMVIDVTVPMVQAVKLSGPGDMTVDAVRTPSFGVSLSGPGDIKVGSVDTKAIDISLSGPGDITLAGRAGNAKVRLSGPGDIHGKGLVVGDVDVSLSGPGDITLDAYGRATGHLSGPGDIYLGAHARCDISKSGPGDVHCGQKRHADDDDD